MTIYLENPAWATTAIRDNWDALRARVPADLLPRTISKTSSAQLAWSFPGTEAAGFPRGAKLGKEYGCGHYGCVYPTGRRDVVFKVTRDISEARFIASLEKMEDVPTGLVKYYGAFALPGARGKRPLFVLWREEATRVGGLRMAYGRDASPDVREETFTLRRLGAFKWHANEIRERLKKSKNYWGLLAEADRLYDWASDFISEDRAVRVGSGFMDRTVEEGLRRLKGAYAVAAHLAACRYIADEMWSSNSVSYLIGEALRECLNEGILLADVHGGNVGVVRRDDQDYWVITDPGHMVPLAQKFADLSLPRI